MNFFRQTITLSIVALLAWQLAMLTWAFIPAPTIEEDLSSTDPENIVSLERTEINVSDLIALHPFGLTGNLSEKQIERKSEIDAPETSLNLKLRGLYMSSGSAPSSAIIEGNDKNQSIYYIGESISGNNQLIIEEIFSQYLIIKRGSRYEKLTLFDELQKQLAELFSQTPETEAVENQDEMEDGSVSVIDQTQNIELTEKLRNIVNALETDPFSLAGTMEIQPLGSGDNFQGYKIAPGSDDILFENLGFVTGDVITGIDNTELDDVNKLMSLMGDLSSKSEVEIKVMRGSQSLAFRYKVR